jgi:hypothetical protein
MATAMAKGSIKMFQRQYGFMFLQPNTGTYVLTAGQTYWANSFVTTTGNGNNIAGITNSIHLANVAAIQPGAVVGLQDDTLFINWATVLAVNVAANTINTDNALVHTMNSKSDIVYIITDGSSQPPQEIEQVVLRDSGGNDTPMKSLTQSEWFAMPSKQAPSFTGDPIAYYYEPHLVGSNTFGYLFTDVNGATDTTKYLYVAYIRELQDIVNTTDLLEMPKEWYRWFLYELAYDLSDDFSVQWTQEKELKRQEARKDALGSNPQRSAAGFMPGNRGGLYELGDGFFSR